MEENVSGCFFSEHSVVLLILSSDNLGGWLYTWMVYPLQAVTHPSTNEAIE